MDSKIKRIVIVTVVLLSMTVLTIVLLANGRQMQALKRNSSKASVSSVSETSASENVKPGNLDAWKRDETFFDNEADSLAAKIMEEMKTLSFKAYSVEKDIRIQVLDYEGNLATGTVFEISCKEPKQSVGRTYKDTNKDGIIYIDRLEPGDYEISLKPVDGYTVPPNSVTIKVKSSVEYSLIEDISLLIHNESLAAREADDRMILSALDTAGKKKRTSFAGDNKVYGVDVSSADGEIDWVKVYDAGIRFAMIRAGYRGAASGQIVADERFAENAKNASRAGLDVGAYFFSQAVDEREAVEEASALLVLSSGYFMTYPLAVRFDATESVGRTDELDKDERTKIMEAFCKTIKSAEYTPCVYSSIAWFKDELDFKKVEKYDVWLSDFNNNPNFDGYYEMWQYSDQGSVPGIENPVGLSISYMGDEP